MWNQSQAYKTTPSSLVGIPRGRIEGFYLDRGIWLFGSWVEREVNAAGDNVQKNQKSRRNRKGVEKLVNSARIRALQRCLGEDMSKSTAGFRKVGTTDLGSRTATDA